MARSWEEERQRDLEKVRRSFEAWDHAMTKLPDSVERAETVMLGTRPSSSDLKTLLIFFSGPALGELALPSQNLHVSSLSGLFRSVTAESLWQCFGL